MRFYQKVHLLFSQHFSDLIHKINSSYYSRKYSKLKILTLSLSHLKDKRVENSSESKCNIKKRGQ